MAPPKKAKADDAKAEAPKLVKMVRDESYPEPHTADIHPDEVANCEGVDGWTKA